MQSSTIMVKPSYYNEIIEKDDGLAIYNTRTGKLIRSFSDQSNQLLHMLQGKDVMTLDDGNQKMHFLYREEFLIDEDRDELTEMHELEIGQVFDRHMHLIILPTEACNFRCTYCYERFERGSMTIETQNKLIKYVEKNIHAFDGLIVSWFGGEPLEAMDVIERLSLAFIDICSQHKKIYFSGITTNGYKLNIDVFKKLKRLHITEYQITIDGLPEDHDKQRMLADGSGSANQILANLLDIKQGIGSRAIRITLRTNFTKFMLKNAGAYADFLREQFGNDRRFGIFWQVAEDYGYLSDKSIAGNFCSEKDYIDLIKKHALQFNNNVFRSAMQPAGTICYAMKRNALVIGSDGAIKKCTCDLDSDKNYFGRVGEFFDEEKHSVWLDREVKKDTACYYCKKRPMCHYRACKKTSNCPPNLYFYREILNSMSEDPTFYAIV